jgi:membrane-bound lytic murein transglycosylase B
VVRLPGAILFVLCAAAGARGQTPPPAQLPVVQLPTPAQPFSEWLVALRAEALNRGISEATVSRALDGLEPLPVVIERDRSQAEMVLTLDRYIRQHVTKKVVRTAAQLAKEHAALLRKVQAKYGVPRGVVIAVWGLESNFGRFSGVRPTVQALATLAYDPRRATMFREELFNALKILDSGDVDPASLRGSWAGAMGQPQFMPSSFLQFAQDFDGDGRRDIWASRPDVFASIAYYLKAHGWNASQTWGREVKLPKKPDERFAKAAPLRTDGCQAERRMTVPLPLSRWRALGVRSLTGAALPNAKIDASLVRGARRAFLVYPNYDALLAYNCAHAYGLSVALLSERIQATDAHR